MQITVLIVICLNLVKKIFGKLTMLNMFKDQNEY